MKYINPFGQVSGAEGLHETRGRHHAPDQSLAAIAYDNGVNAVLRCGTNAPSVTGKPRINHHKRIAVYGTRGCILWSMWGWETCVDGQADGGAHEYPDEDVLGQAGMTEAMFDWLLDDAAAHPLNLDLALQDFSIILAMYMSALNHTVIEFPFEPEPDLVAKLQLRLGEEATGQPC